jgi:hypothetical protein
VNGPTASDVRDWLTRLEESEPQWAVLALNDSSGKRTLEVMPSIRPVFKRILDSQATDFSTQALRIESWRAIMYR